MSETRAYRIAVALAVTAVLAAVTTGCRTEGGRTCRDGSHSTATGQGACSHHGGVRK